MEELNTIYPESPKEINFQVEETKVVKEEDNQMEKMTILWKSCQYGLILIGLAQVLTSGWAVFAPDATTYKNLKGMAATDRAYIKQILNNCGSSNYFADNSDSCQISTSALATLFKGEAVIAHIDLDKLPNSKHATYEAEADAAETPPGNEQSPAK